MEASNLLLLEEVDTPITVGIIAFDEGGHAPCYIVHYDAEYPTLTDLFKKFRGIELQVLNADSGGYYFSVSSDRRILRLRKSEFDEAITSRGAGLAKIAEKIKTEGQPEFQSSYLTTKEVGSQFLECLSANDGEWILVTLASEATMVFVNKMGKIVGIFPLDREFFTVIASRASV